MQELVFEMTKTKKAKELLLGQEGACLMCARLGHPTSHPQTFICRLNDRRVFDPSVHKCNKFLGLAHEG